MPVEMLELLRERDTFALAVKTYEELIALQPPPLPRAADFSRPDLIRLWRTRGIPVCDPQALPGQPDLLKVEFMGWMESELARADALDEAKRRLRSTMWAQATLKASTRRPDAVAVLSRFHAQHWKVFTVADDVSGRERQIADAIKTYARQT